LKIEVVPTWQSLNPRQVEGRVGVVIDVLRATTTITAALANGCRAVCPVSTIREARSLYAGPAKKEIVLGGERKGERIPGFAHGNSPLEYTRDVVAGRVLVLTTSNGTKALRKSAPAVDVIVMALVNAGAVAGYLAGQQRDVVVVCAGTKGSLSLEDTLAAGALLDALEQTGVKIAANDLALAAVQVFRVNRGNLKEAISRSINGRNLIRINHETDISFCASLDRFALVPVFANGRVTSR